jgi:SAM-dependent methyltransferase
LETTDPDLDSGSAYAPRAPGAVSTLDGDRAVMARPRLDRIGSACTREELWSCPACRVLLVTRTEDWKCPRCGQRYPTIAGIPDFRVRGDAYLDLRDERVKALRLAELAETCNLEGLADHYYGMTADVDARRRALYLAHIRRSAVRGETLAGLLPAAGRIIELGSGTGALVAAATRSGRDIVGTDIALRWLVLARRRLSDLGITGALAAADATSLPWPSATFDVAVADSVIEHLDDPARTLKEWARIVRPGGRLILWSSNRFSLAPDPHVGLWGIGLLPRQWANRYVRLRRDCSWQVQLLGVRAIRSLAEAAGWLDVRVESPELPESWGETPRERFALRIYDHLWRTAMGRQVLTHVGPLWQLTAVRGDSACAC